MRELKFRAWDKNLKEMGKPFGLFDVACDELHIDIGLASHYPCVATEALYEIMQYTGIKDKNGKEIYEGDLICIFGNHNGYGSVEFVNDYVGGWILKFQDQILSLGARVEDTLEIVGNIYKLPQN